MYKPQKNEKQKNCFTFNPDFSLKKNQRSSQLVQYFNAL